MLKLYYMPLRLSITCYSSSKEAFVSHTKHWLLGTCAHWCSKWGMRLFIYSFHRLCCTLHTFLVQLVGVLQSNLPGNCSLVVIALRRHHTCTIHIWCCQMNMKIHVVLTKWIKKAKHLGCFSAHFERNEWRVIIYFMLATLKIIVSVHVC